MAIAESHANSATISTTEYSLPNNSTTLTPITTDGVYQVMIDFANMVAGDIYIVRVKEKITSGGTQRTISEVYLSGVQAGPYVIPSLILLHGWDITVQRSAGSDRSISWSIRQVT